MSACISLEKSTTCPAFNSSVISTDSALVGLYPFLQYVSNVNDFDKQLTAYLQNEYVKTKYGTLLGCSKLNLTDTSKYYARYTTSVICNGIVQNSKDACSPSEAQLTPLCADTCALYATNEEEIAVNNQTCDATSPGYMTQVRADFTNCALPDSSLTGSCITGEANEPTECGFSTNLVGLCSYCATSSPNATDSCCVNSNATNRCSNVHLPTTSSMPPLFTVTATAAASSAASSTAAATNSSHSGLSGGQIAGIAVGSVAGLALLVGLGALLFLCLRRRRQSDNDNIFNQPTPARANKEAMHVVAAPVSTKGSFEPVPGGRVARMSALQDENDDLDRRSATRGSFPVGGGAKYSDSSDSEGLLSSPEALSRRRGPPMAGRRHGSLSSTSALGLEVDSSPQSGTAGQVSSPEGVASGQSEQLPYFRDYYSQDDIHPNDKVAVLWAYQPRAADEFDLDRGDMLKVVGIWDDGWATGVRINERAEEFDDTHNAQRDSGVSNGSGGRRDSPPQPQGEIKAFPLVCICLPQHWRKIIDGDLQEAVSP
ncbi:SH3 domain protein [Talaromyces proteolyticus]|uniref:SH3 domain protein n=1 Tax=Talaromyces proteolyticus TaxID=1131652 RepID=A0AAD4L7K8_9EURO|nr:SH3 domain protein [Talaromyces proteolyticus]KAH8705424.1 SH3 domain protein [Talaromyces proteolyticus]